jgi:hypothetical protein
MKKISSLPTETLLVKSVLSKINEGKELRFRIRIGASFFIPENLKRSHFSRDLG